MTYAKADCSRPEGPCEPSDEPACVGELLSCVGDAPKAVHIRMRGVSFYIDKFDVFIDPVSGE